MPCPGSPRCPVATHLLSPAAQSTRFATGLSAESQYQRWFSSRRLSLLDSERLTRPEFPYEGAGPGGPRLDTPG